MLAARVQLPHRAESVRAARGFLAAVLAGWHVEEPVCDDAALLVSEVAANAVRHSTGGLTIDVHLLPGVLRVAVTDHTSALPRPRPADTSAEGGRGLQIVDAYAARWGTDCLSGGTPGKRVWFELALPA